MIFKLVKYNLKKYSFKNVVALIIISIILSVSNLYSITIFNDAQNLTLTDIFINIFGGVSNMLRIEDQMVYFLQWLMPHILILYLLNIYISTRLINDMILILPRLRSKIKWSITMSITIIITTFKYYMILFSIYICTSYVFIGNSLFKGNAYKNIIFIILSSVCMTAGLTILIMSLNIISIDKFNIGIVIIFFVICSNFLNISNQLLLKILPLNNMMLIRHSNFSNCIKNFNISYSIIYFALFLSMNVVINIITIKKSEVKKLKVF